MINNLTIIMHHYVRDSKNLKYNRLNGFDTNLFEEQIIYLNKHYNVITMEEVIYSIDKLF